ncbi:MAG: GH36-type glycosyl hydrolase domain-containing protein, partial [Acetanaerobacterium sp.]
MADCWEFIDNEGTFRLTNAHKSSGLYFPLANEDGMMSSITPTLHGDMKSGQNCFFTPPVTSEDLHNTKSGRNFWLEIKGYGPWSAAGASSRQIADDTERVTVEAGFLWHKLTRENNGIGIKAETTSLVPIGAGRVELMKVTITNTGAEPLPVTPTAAVPVYARSADNIRDHRHVTSLLNRIHVVEEGIEVCPAMTFDERGHRVNELCYNVYAADETGELPLGAIPTVEEFIGEGGCLEWPGAVRDSAQPLTYAGESVEGYEAVGALCFARILLAPGQSRSYVVVLSMTDERPQSSERKRWLAVKEFDRAMQQTTRFWGDKLRDLSFSGGDSTFDQWMKWVSLQPILRRIYGCSFLPHHDYGKGGRGWRDLWQDCLALMLLETDTVRPLLLNNFGGVRMDGTNATIIGARPGEFIADRNNISRVWSDHGVWPCYTTRLYIDQSGDIDFLFEQQSYFKDRLSMRSTAADEKWDSQYGNRQKDSDGNVYTATVLEHILVQNLTAFFNVGEHNNIRIENADWNDAFDMAAQRGETVAFTAFYAGNLISLAQLLRESRLRGGIERATLASELTLLLDSMGDAVDYNDPAAKKVRLLQYTMSCAHSVSGKTISVTLDALANDLEKKGRWLARHIRENERVRSAEG